MIGVLWAVSVALEIAWFFSQGRFIGRLPMARWLVVCGAATVVRMALTGALGASLLALFVAQLLHALTFATHHTACIAMVSHHFPGRLRGRGQALFTVIGYGLGGVVGVLAGGAFASRFGFQAMYGVAALLALVATLCATQVARLEARAP
jgi:PPP family 3-phenylpropionic acid transporter